MPRRSDRYETITRAQGERTSNVMRVAGARVREHLAVLEARYGARGRWAHALEQLFGPSALDAADSSHAPTALADLADLIVAASQANAGADAVLREVRLDRWIATSFEARAARLVQRVHHPFRFGVTADERVRGDIVVESPSPFVLDVKHGRVVSRPELEAALTSRVWDAVALAFPGHRLSFDWWGRDVQTIPDGADAIHDVGALAARASVAILRHARHAGAEPSARRVVEIPGMGTVIVESDAADQEGRVRLQLPSHAERHARRLAHEISSAGFPDGPGTAVRVVVLCAERANSDAATIAAAATDVFAHAGASLSHVAGAIALVVDARSDGVVEETHPVPNPDARIGLHAIALPEARSRARLVRFERVVEPHLPS